MDYQVRCIVFNLAGSSCEKSLRLTNGAVLDWNECGFMMHDKEGYHAKEKA